MTEAYPLSWPVAWPRSTRRQQAPFRMTLAKSRDELLRELDLMGARGVVISSNAVLLKNRLPAARQGWIADPGVSVYFTRSGRQLCIPCDKWTTIEANVRAIGKTVEALRGLERWGAKHMVDAAFRGFEALPAETSGSAWWDVLGVDPHASRDLIDSAYRALIKDAHPDRGGDVERFHAVRAAYEQAKGSA